jgi:hypothetical protein
MDDRTRLVGLAMLAELHCPFHGNGTAPQHPLLETVRVTGEALGRYNAVRTLFPDPLRDADQFVPCAEELQDRLFDVAEFGNGEALTTLPIARPRNGDKLFDIVRVKEWDNPRNWHASSLSWLVRSGQWAYWSMNESGRILLCRIAAASLVHRELETAWLTLKLGRQLGFSLLLRGDERSLDTTIEDLLAEICELPMPSDRAAGWDSVMHRRFNMAAFSLCNLGALNDIAWPANYRFAGYAGDDHVPAGWISARIRFEAPVIPEPREGKSAYQAMHVLRI